MTAVLTLEKVCKRYGVVSVLDDISITIEPGERCAIIGPNGAGKTTLFSAITGRLPSSSGRILFGDRDITKMAEDRRTRLGIAQTFQRSSLFLGLTVHDNVMLSVQRSAGMGFRMVRPVRRRRALIEAADELVERVGLQERRDDLVSALSHGERRQLELALALAGAPTLLLMDEPVAGLSPAETASFVELVRKLPSDITLVLIEHDIDVVMALASRVTVLDAGRLLAEGAPSTIAADERVQEAYLGKLRGDDLFVEG